MTPDVALLIREYGRACSSEGWHERAAADCELLERTHPTVAVEWRRLAAAHRADAARYRQTAAVLLARICGADEVLTVMPVTAANVAAE